MADVNAEHVWQSTRWRVDATAKAADKKHGFIKKGIAGPGSGPRRLIKK
jgi:hypothetical protein